MALRPPETEFERGTRQFGYLITKTILFLVFFVLLISIVFHHDPLESMLFASALTVGLTPEFLPMITTVTLGQSAVHMVREKVIAKLLPFTPLAGVLGCCANIGLLTARHPSSDNRSSALAPRLLTLGCGVQKKQRRSAMKLPNKGKKADGIFSGYWLANNAADLDLIETSWDE